MCRLGVGVSKLSPYKLGRVEGYCWVVCEAKTGFATSGCSNPELAGTVSILQPNLCKIQVGSKKRRDGRRAPLRETGGGRAHPVLGSGGRAPDVKNRRGERFGPL